MNLKSVLGIIVGLTLIVTFGATTPVLQHQTEAFQAEDGRRTETVPRAPAAISGDNVYITWWTNNTANGDGEVMFRASNDNGATFGDKINLSNTTNAGSTRAEIDSDADNVVVTWWERNQTSDTPVMRVSTDNGATFGPMLRLATNGTIGEAEEEEG